MEYWRTYLYIVTYMHQYFRVKTIKIWRLNSNSIGDCHLFNNFFRNPLKLNISTFFYFINSHKTFSLPYLKIVFISTDTIYSIIIKRRNSSKNNEKYLSFWYFKKYNGALPLF